ncbi:MAG: hypothetical protein CM1200mP16_01760 [Nitrospina sp.]|nr:MAG: hypothetical protein CM1200mP16_01760 [Nitrospina sp.]
MKLIGHQKLLTPFLSCLPNIICNIFFGVWKRGKNFNESLYIRIAKGTTTKNDIQGCLVILLKRESKMDILFGLTNITILNSFGPDIIKDMIIVFDKNGL